MTDQKVLEAVVRSMECSVSSMRQEFRRGLNALATIGSTAPFVGLFGTVIGIMNSFRGTTAERATYISIVGGGIAEALVTTSLGLLVAVPAVWAFNYFSTKLESFELEMNSSIDAISTYLCGYQEMRRGR